jgi:hypothetical protein
VDPDLIRHYERVLKFRGSGLAEVRDQKCMGCSVMLRPQTFNDVKTGKLIFCDSCQRILYYDPSKDTPSEQPMDKPNRKRPRPKLDASHAWYYRAEYNNDGEVFLSFSNSDAMAVRRVYDAATGRRLGDLLAREGAYRQAFPEEITDAIRLNGNWTDDEQDAWEDELPSSVLDALQRDLDLARAERAAHHEPSPTSVAS